MKERPASRPSIWPIAKGTSLDDTEKESLWAAGFDLQNIETRSQVHNADDADVRPKYRDGRVVVVARVITKEMEARIKRAAELICTIHGQLVVIQNEHVEFTLTTNASEQNEESYLVVVSSFPSCTCEDFQKRLREGKKYMPCKHLYFVYTKQLGLDVFHQRFVHQAALTKRELHQALKLLS